MTLKNLARIAALALGATSISLSAFSATTEENWTSLCKKCHDADGSGGTKIGKKLKLMDYTDPAVQAKLDDAEMFKVIKEGVKNEKGKETMPAYAEKLTDPEITELIALVRSFKKG